MLALARKNRLGYDSVFHALWGWVGLIPPTAQWRIYSQQGQQTAQAPSLSVKT